MKLFMVGASPFARKVRAAAVELGLQERLELVHANPHERPVELVSRNPLSRVPTLVTDAGEVIADSFPICEFLASLVEGQGLLPTKPGAARRAVLFRYTLAHGVMECAVTRRVESLKAPEPDRIAWMDRQAATIGRALDWFEASEALDGPHSLDRLTLAAALAYLDFRFPDDGWRDGRPRLAGWQEAAEAWRAMATTRYFA